MKRDRDLQSSSSCSSGKAKMCFEDTGMDELFAVLGYKVKSSDMADVAEKLEQLEMAMTMEDNNNNNNNSSVSVNDTVHYNPADLSGWVDTLLSELNNTNSTSQSSVPIPIYDDDLRAIPGGAIFPNNQDTTTNKRMKPSSGSVEIESVQIPIPIPVPVPVRPMVLVDSQETGVRLVHTLMACAEAIQQENLKLGDALMKHVGVLAVSQIGAMRKVATCFAEALARKIYKIYPQQDTLDSSSYSDVLQMHFYETGPYLKFAHFTANQAILEAFAGLNKVHVIDFSLKQGMQWPVLMQALALRPGGPPSFRLTAVGPPQPDNTDALQQVGWKLAQLADSIGVEFEFRGFVTNSLADLDVGMFDIREDESVAVNSVFELHKLLARPGAVDKVLDMIKGMNPKIVTVVEQEANHNGPVFLDRFNEALHYYSTMFDSLESAGGANNNNNQDLVMTEVYLGRQICNVVACEGVERVERHETLSQWRGRMGLAGFEPVHMGSNAFKQASMLLAHFAGGDGYRVEENDGCLMLGWHTRPLITTSAWQFPTKTGK